MHQDTLGSAGVIVINETMAHTFWPKEDQVGRAIRLGDSNGARLTVVGVVGDVRYRGLDEPVRGQFFRPYTQAGWPVMGIVVRAIGTPSAFTAPIKKALAEVLPDRRSEEHTSELQSPMYLVCRLLLEKKKQYQT